MANIVEIAIRGIDEATKVFEQVGRTATQSMERAEQSVRDVDDAINNVSDLNVSTGGTETAMENASSSVRDVQDAIEETESTGVSFGDKMKNVFEKVAEQWKKITVVAGSAGAGLEGFARTQSQVNATLDRVAISTGMTREELRELANEMADTTTSSAQQAEAFEMLVQRGIDTKEQFREIIPHISNLGTATGQDLQPTLESVERILAPLGQGVENIGENIDQLGRIMLQTDIPISSLERNLNRIPDELQALGWGLDEVSAGLEIFRDKGFTGREAVREFRRTVEESEGDMDKFLELVGLTADEWEEYQKKVEPQVGLTEEMAAANENNMTVMEKVKENVANLMVEYGAFADLASMLAPILMSLGPILKGVTMATQAFNFVLKMNPIGLVITAIVALIAIVSLLWKHWDTVSQWLSESWQWIKDVAIELFGGLGEYFSQFWEWIKGVFEEVWNSILEFLQFAWDWISEKVVEWLTGIGDWLSEKWNEITETISNVWNGILEFIENIWQNIVDAIKNYINRVKTNIENIFNKIKDFISDTWNNVKNTATEIWNSIVDKVQEIVEKFKTKIEDAFTGIKDGILDAFEGVKEGAKRVWDKIVDVVKAPINTIIGFVNKMIDGLNNIKIKIPKIPSWVPGIGGKGGNTLGFNIPKIPSLATGGVVREPTLALVGDAGAGNPEIVAPQKMLAQIVGDELKKALGSLVTNSRTEQPQPLYITVQIGRSEFRRFVEDITKEQERNTRKEEKFR